MMEMSDVGVFEYNLEGKLIHANAAWYKLSSHPRNLPAHAEYSFMDLVMLEDRALVMSIWNTLTQGIPVTFEMRWKPQPGTEEAAQWVLSACVPVLDDNGRMLSIAGNTIDINAQKKTQEAAQAQVEALERARLSELKFVRLAQLSPAAIFIYIPGAGMKFLNDQFFQLTGYSRPPVDQSEWFNLIAEDDVAKVKDDWINILRGERSDGIQFRLKKIWVDRDGVRSNTWVQSSSYPELDENGKVRSIMGTFFDISQFKWAESVQRRRIEEAEEAKRQQENFIDMTSHEIRTPLPAIIQCADSVIVSLHHLQSESLAASLGDPNIIDIRAELATCVESLETIVSCSLHQKRVIDDMLTLSKLDSKLIVITPIRVQPSAVISEALKIFDIECHQLDIKLEFREEQTLQGMDWVMLDPSRLVQILINLLTNAIKFTKDRPKRSITVTLGGSWDAPPLCWTEVRFVHGAGPEAVNVVDQPEWGRGRKVYLWLRVVDTGCGMSNDEQKMLFERFSQATPRTHIKYGGSGLGLFISKSLSRLQGGAIGVRSKSGTGSTFAFYVSARLADRPAGHSRSIPQPNTSAEEAMKKVILNVLIVEDNVVNQRVLRSQLEKVGWKVSVVGNGQEALDWLEKSVYWQPDKDNKPQYQDIKGVTPNDAKSAKNELDIMLMDFEMPVMDGLTCTRMVRHYEHQGFLKFSRQIPSKPSANRSTFLATRSPSWSESAFFTPTTLSSDDSIISLGKTQEQNLRLPILGVSANARIEQIKQALDAGMDDVVSKPFRIPELWPKVEGLIDKGVEGRSSSGDG